MLRRLAVLLALGLVVAVPAVRADDQTDPAGRLPIDPRLLPWVTCA